jgi:hypothetical protein
VEIRGGMILSKPYRGLIINRTHQLSKGLIGYWLLNENSGNTFKDYSGYQNDGTFINSPSWMPNGITLPGSTDYLRCNVRNCPSGASPRSVVVWFTPQSTGGVLFAINTTTHDKFLILCLNYFGQWYLFSDNINTDNNVTLSGSEIPAINQLNCLVFVLSDSTHAQYYLNGLHVKDIVFPIPINTGTPNYITIGDRLDLVGQNFTGYIHSVSFYNRALIDKEVYSLFHSPYEIFQLHDYILPSSTPPIKRIFYYLYNQDF